MSLETAPSGPQPALSVVIPALNEAQRLPATLSGLTAYADRRGLTLEAIVVDDGSTDATADLVEEFPTGPAMGLRLICNESNRGKGYSVRRGMLQAQGEAVLFMDADGSTAIGEVEKLLPVLESGCDVVIGSRDMEDSELDPAQPAARRLLGAIFRTLRRCIMLRDIRDTQCGFKLFRRAAAQEIFTLQREDGFAFDCEVLWIARSLGHTIREVGVVWRDSGSSRVRPLRDGMGMLWALLRIRLHHRRRR